MAKRTASPDPESAAAGPAAVQPAPTPEPAGPQSPVPTGPGASIDVPLAPLSGYTPLHLDVSLTGEQAATLKRIALAMKTDSARAIGKILDQVKKNERA